MNEEEKKAIEIETEIAEKFKRLYLKDFNNEEITNKDRLSYLECALLSNFIEKLQKENEELKDLIIHKNEYTKKLEEDLFENCSNYVIPIQKVKDIIERINYDIKRTKEIIHTSNRKNDYQIVRLRAMNTKSLDIKNRLSKLIESE